MQDNRHVFYLKVTKKRIASGLQFTRQLHQKACYSLAVIKLGNRTNRRRRENYSGRNKLYEYASAFSFQYLKSQSYALLLDDSFIRVDDKPKCQFYHFTYGNTVTRRSVLVVFCSNFVVSEAQTCFADIRKRNVAPSLRYIFYSTGSCIKLRFFALNFTIFCRAEIGKICRKIKNLENSIFLVKLFI